MWILEIKIVGDDSILTTSDANEVVTHPDVDIVVELIGGYSAAKELTLKAIENGKHVVKSNIFLLRFFTRRSNLLIFFKNFTTIVFKFNFAIKIL